MLPEIEDWGLINYGQACAKQARYVDEILEGQRGETLVFCHHPPVVSLGRGTREGDVFQWEGELVEVPRGGRATYHGPSQVVLYPLLDLGGSTPSYRPKKIKKRDLHAYMRILEESIIKTLGDYGVQAQGQPSQGFLGEKAVESGPMDPKFGVSKPLAETGFSTYTGVWVGERKMASIGIACRKWVSFHGAAMNLFKDPTAFRGIQPCGFSPEVMVSLKEVCSKKISRSVFQKEWASNLIFCLYMG